MKVRLTIEATCDLPDKNDIEVMKSVNPENQLATIRLNGGKVKSTVEPANKARIAD